MMSGNDVITDISVLYELSLSVGTSLKIEDNCRAFLDVLMARKNIDSCSVWLEADISSSSLVSKKYQLIYAVPEPKIKDQNLFHSLLNDKDINPAFPFGFIQSLGDQFGKSAYYKLANVGYLIIHSTATQNKFLTSLELNKVRKVIDKFSFSLAACAYHDKSIKESEQRIETEKKLNNQKNIHKNLVDLTQIKIQRSEEKYRNIIENMHLGLLELDVNGNILDAYDYFCVMTGYSKQELIGKNAHKMFVHKKEDQSKIKDLENMIHQGESSVCEVEFKKKDGQNVWIILSAAPMYNIEGDITGSVGIYYDITGRKRLEHRLVETSKKAYESNRAKELFLANMSHEIRTPMNAVIGMSQLLTKTQLDQKQKDYLDAIISSGEGLLQIINDILDVSKIEAGKFELDPENFLLTKFIHAIITPLEYKAEEKGIKLITSENFSPSLVLFADNTRIKQVLINLINNAIKFTEKGNVELNLEAEEVSDEHVVVHFKVRDTGVGIDKKHLKTIFKSFEQGDRNIVRKAGGTGLGLTIAENLVELLGGKLKVKSDLGKGSEFFFSLLINRGNEQELKNVTSQQTDYQELKKYKYLMAEDNHFNQMLAQDIFDEAGLNLTITNNGKEAIETFKTDKYDLVLMDMRMPIMDGMEATQVIRYELNSSVPIIALTANAIKGDREKYLSYGVNDYLSKPYHSHDLFDKIASLLKVKLDSQPVVTSNTIDVELEPKKEKNQLYSLEQLKLIFNGRKDLIYNMMDKFVMIVPEMIEELKDAHSKVDHKALGSLSHKLLGSIRTFKIEPAGKNLKDIELAIEKGKTIGDVEDLYKEALLNINEALEEIKKDLEEYRTPS